MIHVDLRVKLCMQNYYCNHQGDKDYHELVLYDIIARPKT